jgi:hypothetical protein
VSDTTACEGRVGDAFRQANRLKSKKEKVRSPTLQKQSCAASAASKIYKMPLSEILSFLYSKAALKSGKKNIPLFSTIKAHLSENDVFFPL